MKIGDLVKITSIRRSVTGIVVKSEREDFLGWVMIMDSLGNIIWWPPSEMQKLVNDRILVIDKNI